MESNAHMPNLAQAQVEVEAIDRGSLLTKAALAVGAFYGAAAVGPFVQRAMAKSSDIDILNFALTLEYLEAEFYNQASKQVSDLSSEIKGYVTEFGSNEQEHVDALSATISDMGSKPVKAPEVDFGDAFSSQDSFLELAVVLEDTGVSAYNGAAPAIKSKDLLAVAGGIVQIEARHAAVIRYAAGDSPAPDAFDPTLDEQQVLDAVQPFIAS